MNRHGNIMEPLFMEQSLLKRKKTQQTHSQKEVGSSAWTLELRNASLRAAKKTPHCHTGVHTSVTGVRGERGRRQWTKQGVDPYQLERSEQKQQNHKTLSAFFFAVGRSYDEVLKNWEDNLT